MVKIYRMKLEKFPDAEEIEIIHATTPSAVKYIGSLKYALQWKIKKIKGRIEYSKSGLSAWVDRIYVRAESNKHIHEIYIYEAYAEYHSGKHEFNIPIAIADWVLDGEEMAILILPKYLMERIRSIVETYIKSNDVSDGEFDIELRQCRVLAPGDWY